MAEAENRSQVSVIVEPSTKKQQAAAGSVNFQRLVGERPHEGAQESIMGHTL